MRKSMDDAKKALERTLAKSGYTALKQAGVKSKRPDFPDLRVGNHRERYPSVGGFAPTTPRQEPIAGAKAFPVGHSHKQGMELILPSDDLQHMGGKKT